MKNLKLITSIALMFSLMLLSCGKENGNSRMTVKLTDAPGDYQEVNIDLVGVEIHYEDEFDSEEGWLILETYQGIYDLLELQNNVTAVIADEDDLPNGKITQIRLILGDENTVVIDNIVYPLELSSQDKTGLKLNLDSKVKRWKDLELILDFDAEKSIVETGVGQYKLKPVVEVKSIMYN